MSKTEITSWASKDGHFRRQESSFRDSISSESGAQFPPEKGRYHLYVSLACPWAHRVLIVHKLKGLGDLMPVSIVHPHMNKMGWSFNGEGYEGQGADDLPDHKIPNVIPDQLYNFDLLRQLYFKADKDYSARFTVPIIWDSKTETIVNNESSEVIRFLNTAFDDLVDAKYRGLNFYPEDLRSEIDSINSWVYDDLNNGVYKCGFAGSQTAYLENIKKLDKAMRKIDDMLKGKTYLVGDRLTEADIRLYTTAIRFDPVYNVHFKCNVGLIRHSYPNINKWMKNLYWNNPAFKDTTDFDHIKIHYYSSHPQINPTRIVPYGPLPAIEDL